MTGSHKTAYMGKSQWKTPLNLAITFHVAIVLGCVYVPQLLNSKPKYEKIYTVNLENFVEAAPQPAPPAPQPVVKKTVETNARKVAPIAKPQPAPEPVAPEKAISLKPRKKKIKKKLPTKNNEQLRAKRIADAKKAQRAAEEAARIAQMEAELERKMLEDSLRDARQVAQQNNNRTKNVKSTSRSSSRTGGAQLSGVEKQFFNAIVSHLHSYWQLPEHKSWDRNLSTTIAITINSKGKVKSMFIENSSGDKIFDQYVQKALRAADPLPKIPPAMKKSYFDIGLVFKPGGIQ